MTPAETSAETPAGAPTVVRVRRYPVKSMGGETLEQAELDERGLRGDRWYAVVDDDGRFASGKDSRRFRRRDAVFSYVARTDQTGRVSVERGEDRWEVGGDDLDAELSAAFGDPVRVLPEGHTSHYDASPVSLVGTATLAWCARELGVDADPRRLRVNLLVATAEPFEEEDWAGRSLRIGGVGLRVVERIERCRTVDLEQDGATGTTRWLKALGAERDACVGIYAEVTDAGTLAAGDEVVLG